MAEKDAPAGARGFQIFKKPGSDNQAAINLDTGMVIETDGKGRLAIHIQGVRHVVLSDQSLEELTGADAPPAEQD